MLTSKTILAGLLLVLAACSQEQDTPIVVYGDSTAIASRIPWSEKLWNIAPSWDRQRWFNMLGRPVTNNGKAGALISRVTERITADPSKRGTTTIIYDLVNVEEDPAGYVAELARAVSRLETDEFLIIPQVPDAYAVDRGQNMPSRRMRPLIDRAVAARWPAHTFTPIERQAFFAQLADPTTRYDGIHRNARGQQIEAAHIKRWLDARGW